ncbi:MAG: DinB family protein [Anaerolineales bacterium]|nr:DinB family protein [Anaerolineales bacterium]
MAFKLGDTGRLEALQIDGAIMFDPRRTGKPMQEWVLIPKAHSELWERFARTALSFVENAAEMRKREILEKLSTARAMILNELSLLEPGQENTVYLGTWDAKDLLAHLAGWDYTNIRAIESILEGQTPLFYSFQDRGWRSYNERLVEEYCVDDLDELFSLVKKSRKELLDFLESILPDDFSRDFGVRFKGYKVTIERLLDAEASDEQEHFDQIVNYFKTG